MWSPCLSWFHAVQWWLCGCALGHELALIQPRGCLRYLRGTLRTCESRWDEKITWGMVRLFACVGPSSAVVLPVASLCYQRSCEAAFCRCLSNLSITGSEVLAFPRPYLDRSACDLGKKGNRSSHMSSPVMPRLQQPPAHLWFARFSGLCAPYMASCFPASNW